ncbi:MAG: nucleotide pyrophosphohydrolase [Firmicutes bacterium]|jgi:NTP pyrophosphatase (non-canonical NTP hydrolase)|nr:nucleotide pyrophosphohydrolase [Bacillota bacterium]
MEMQEMQERVDRWIGQFQEGYFPPSIMMLRLAEEVGELAREINHVYGMKPKRQDESESSVAMELGDCLFVLVSLANSLALDLNRVFEQVMEKFEIRDHDRWTRKDSGFAGDT